MIGHAVTNSKKSISLLDNLYLNEVKDTSKTLYFEFEYNYFLNGDIKTGSKSFETTGTTINYTPIIADGKDFKCGITINNNNTTELFSINSTAAKDKAYLISAKLYNFKFI